MRFEIAEGQSHNVGDVLAIVGIGEIGDDDVLSLRDQVAAHFTGSSVAAEMPEISLCTLHDVGVQPTGVALCRRCEAGFVKPDISPEGLRWELAG